MKLVLLGDPVEHSRSPAIQGAALAAAGIEGTYEARRVEAADLTAAVAEVRYGTLDGANVTMPHKERAFHLADRVSEAALRAGAVNTLAHRNGMAMGENTDISGLLTVWDESGQPDAAPVLVLGSGGAAAAALVAFAARAVTIAARSAETARALLERTRVDGEIADWGTAVDGAVVVNATPIGMEGEDLPDGVIEAAAGLIDLPYRDRPTPGVEVATRLGLSVADGLDALVAQAAGSFEYWTGLDAPVEVMRSAAASR